MSSLIIFLLYESYNPHMYNTLLVIVKRQSNSESYLAKASIRIIYPLEQGTFSHWVFPLLPSSHFCSHFFFSPVIQSSLCISLFLKFLNVIPYVLKYIILLTITYCDAEIYVTSKYGSFRCIYSYVLWYIFDPGLARILSNVCVWKDFLLYTYSNIHPLYYIKVYSFICDLEATLLDHKATPFENFDRYT